VCGNFEVSTLIGLPFENSKANLINSLCVSSAILVGSSNIFKAVSGITTHNLANTIFQALNSSLLALLTIAVSFE
jgi:hypothetical protein